jgi:hypothetical protein
MQFLTLFVACSVIGQTEVPNLAKIGVVQFGTISLDLFADARNTAQKQVELWQFPYEPAFAPQTDTGGKIVLSGPTRLATGAWEISFKLLLGNDIIDELALRQVRLRYPEQADKIKEGNVVYWPLKWIGFRLPASMLARYPSIRLGEDSWNLNTSDSVEVKLWFGSETEAKDAADHIDGLSLEVKYSKSASKTESNSILLETRHIKASQLRARLKAGKGGIVSPGTEHCVI